MKERKHAGVLNSLKILFIVIRTAAFGVGTIITPSHWISRLKNSLLCDISYHNIKTINMHVQIHNNSLRSSIPCSIGHDQTRNMQFYWSGIIQKTKQTATRSV